MIEWHLFLQMPWVSFIVATFTKWQIHLARVKNTNCCPLLFFSNVCY